MDLPQEIERRFIVTDNDLMEAQAKNPSTFITDVYVESENTPPLRIRTSDLPDGSRTVIATVKMGEGLKRAEPFWVLDSAFAKGPLLHKARYPWSEGERHFHVEIVYVGPNPCIAEVEFPSEDDAALFTPPSHWIEVTGIKKYSNFSIAKYGWPGNP